MDIGEIFASLGIILLIGYSGGLAYAKTKIPESVFMIMIGLLIGPILGLVQPAVILPIVPFFSSLALIIIMLDSGLELNIFKVFKDFGTGLMFTVLVALMCTILIGTAIHLVFGWEFLPALLLGLIASGNTTVSVMSLIKPLDIAKNIKNILFLETIINDFTLILGASIILLLITQGNLADTNIQAEVAKNISISIALGLFVGHIWIKLLKQIKFHKFSYIGSIGALFLLYGIAEKMQVNGIVAALLFSLFLGNHFTIYERIKIKKTSTKKYEETNELVKTIYLINSNMSFLVRIFFFVLIGALFDVSKIFNSPIVPIVISSIFLVVIARLISIKTVSFIRKIDLEPAVLIATMIPNGLVATVIAFMTISKNVSIPTITDVVLLLVLCTNIFSSVATMVYAKNAQKIKEQVTEIK